MLQNVTDLVVTFFKPFKIPLPQCVIFVNVVANEIIEESFIDLGPVQQLIRTSMNSSVKGMVITGPSTLTWDYIPKMQERLQ